MSDPLGFDPYDVLGLAPDADEIAIQLAHRARIREAHPDRAGAAGLERAKRLNIARDWLLDGELRAELDLARTGRPGRSAAAGEGRPGARWARGRRAGARDGPAEAGSAPSEVQRRDAELRAFLAAIETISPDERARVNYSLGETRPVDLARYAGYLGPRLRARSRALRNAVERAWARGPDEAAPSVPLLGRLLPTGFLVANAYAQWILLEAFFRSELAEVTSRGRPIVEPLAARCMGPWRGSVGQPRYGPRQPEVLDFFAAASSLPLDAAARLARSWSYHLGRDGRGHPSELVGPGVWLPAPADCPDVLTISGFVAATDASRILPPMGLDARDRSSFRFALRLTAHALALGLVGDRAHDYLRPWRDAVSPMTPRLRQAGRSASTG